MPSDFEWIHSQQQETVVRAIEANGWRPDLNTGTKFGCGVYFAKGLWHTDAQWTIQCEVHLQDTEIITQFQPIKGFETKGGGNSEGHFERYLTAMNVTAGRPKVGKGDSPQNKAIRDHFLSKGIKAVRFIEHDREVLVVYDTSVITIVGVSPV